MSRPATGGTYEVRFGLNIRTMALVAVTAAFTAFAVAAPPDAFPGGPVGWVLRALTLLVFGFGGLLILVTALSRRVAFRAAADGVTLGTPPYPEFGRNRRPLRVPWGDLTEVVLFDFSPNANATIRYVGLRVRPGARDVATTYDLSSKGWRNDRRFLGHVPEDVLSRSRTMIGWRLDEERLVEAMAAFAPHVRVLRVAQDGSVSPVGGQLRDDDVAAEARALETRIAAGLPAWTRQHTAEWRAAAPGWLLARGLPALGWLMLLPLLGLGVEGGETACTEADPCGTDWVGTIAVVTWAGQVVWLLLLPATAWWPSPLLALALTLAAVGDPSPAPLAAAAGAWLLGAWTWAVGRARRQAGARRQALARRVAGAERGWPGPRRLPLLGGRILLGAGLLLLGGWMLVWGVGEVRATARDVASAPRVTGIVAGYVDEDTMRVRVATDPPQDVVFHLGEDRRYPVGARLTVIAGHRMALAAQPYDASSQVVFGAAAMLAGAVVLARVARARRRLGRLLTRPQPALAMRAAAHRSRRPHARSAVVLHAADDFNGDDPLLVVPVEGTWGLRPPSAADLRRTGEETRRHLEERLPRMEQETRAEMEEALEVLDRDPERMLRDLRKNHQTRLETLAEEEPQPGLEELRRQVREDLRALDEDPQQALLDLRTYLEEELAKEPRQRVEEFREQLSGDLADEEPERRPDPEEARASWSATVPVDVYGVPAEGAWLAVEAGHAGRDRHLVPTRPARPGWRARLGRGF